MITRIKINGFKSLLDTELYLSSFTCIAGANAVGKSNLFDALVFLSRLADMSLVQAAKSVRSDDQKHSNVRDIFYRYGSMYLPEMSFEIDMIVPKTAEDDLGQTATATITTLRYKLELKLNSEESLEPISIQTEILEPISLGEMKKNIFFEASKEWKDFVLDGRRSSNSPFISTDGDKIRIHQDGNKGRTTDFISSKMPRTLLSTVTAESPTAFLVRQEMRNWLMLQFEPTALRQPNNVFEVKNAQISANGANMPATLYRLHSEQAKEQGIDLYQNLTNQLKDLIEGVTELSIDKDDKRDLLTLQLNFKGGLKLPAQSLSDGTLRFLALAILKEDTKSSGLVCLEEPENGINPKKIKEMINVLEGIAGVSNQSEDTYNNLRQVIINSHSPIVVRNVSANSLLLAKHKEKFIPLFNKKVRYTGFAAISETWRTDKTNIDTIALGEILAYLGEEAPLQQEEFIDNKATPQNMTTSISKKKAPNKLTVAEHTHQLQLHL